MASFSSAVPSIHSHMDSGAIIHISTRQSLAGSTVVKLKLKPEKCLEAAGSFKQWFHFDAHNLPTGSDTNTFFEIVDAGESTFPDWSGYKVCMTSDRKTWDRVDSTKFEDGVLSWVVSNLDTSSLTFAYFPTYSLERQETKLREWLATEKCTHSILGHSVQGRPLHSLVFTPTSTLRNVIWIQHRQHPGEVSASWFCEGVMSKLLSLPPSSPLLQTCKIIVVPNVCPDGGHLGHLRTNASGANLNRCWGIIHNTTAPGQTTPPAPEVVAMTSAMISLDGPDLMLDIHQDEEKPYVFISKTPLGVPSCTPPLRLLRSKFHSILRSKSVDFETPGPIDPVGYPEPSPGTANLNICSAAVAERWPGCLSLTMEHPYKGNDNRGKEYSRGFTVEQCRELGEKTVEAVEEILPDLIRKRGGKKRKETF
ncbi:hypothetical protein TrST_g4355 [Triparma strigata]|uniref:Peptidase M14 domain-containing protein n=1 Tax=Triparma strigata TaxID=1606541 RepID=A0A9W7B8E9_9STRA|nr:hypothetical protein TrST_g4355 [Triparma strigata]